MQNVIINVFYSVVLNGVARVNLEFTILPLLLYLYYFIFS